MAFQSGTLGVTCYSCRTNGHKFFEMYQSFRPEHAYVDEQGRIKAALFCIPCELRYREDEWVTWTHEQQAIAGADYVTLKAVQKAQKDRAKEGWSLRSTAILNAKKALKALRECNARKTEQAVQVNYVQCIATMEEGAEEGAEPWVYIHETGDHNNGNASSSSATATETALGASDDGSGGGGVLRGVLSKRQKKSATLPVGRSDEKLIDVIPDLKLTSKEAKRYVIKKSHDLARGLLGLIKGSEATLGAFAQAGKMMLKQVELYQKLMQAHKRWESSRTQTDFVLLEQTELAYEEAHEYQTAIGVGSQSEQTKYLKALDYGDNICYGWRRFYVCKAGGQGQRCGLAFPSKLWFQKGRVSSVNRAERLMPGNWQFKCCCMWEYLQEEAADHPDTPADKWFKDMLAEYGDVKNFPHIGCGANYVPYKRGPSMVCEILMHDGNGRWEAFLADHTPEALDDQLKKISYEKLSEAFGTISPEFLLRAIPMTMPMTHLVSISGKRMEGVAKYPLDAWAKADAPCFTTEKWAVMCLLLAEAGRDPTKIHGISREDQEVFERLFDIASSMGASSSI